MIEPQDSEDTETPRCATSPLHGGVGEAEDRAVLAVALRKALQHRQPDQVSVEPDRLVVVGARTADAHCADRKVLGPASSLTGPRSVGHDPSLCAAKAHARRPAPTCAWVVPST
jgi:hypothetical protein